MKKRPPKHPGLILKHHYLEPLKLSITDLATNLEVSRKTISHIVNGRSAISTDLALRLSKAFNTSPQLWLNLQQNYNLWYASRASKTWQKIPSLSLQVAS